MTASATHIKVCCISSAAEARLAIDAGASALGLVSAMPSGPGVIEEALIAEIAAHVPPPIATFLLTCLQDADAIADQHARCGTSVLQLVDRVEPAELARLKGKLRGTKVVQVIHVRDADAIEEAREAEPWVDGLLLDSGNPKLAVKELGGTGRVHDWDVSARLREAVSKPVWLAGGLNAGNVAQAIARVRPFGVDICSGVREGGALSAAKLAAYRRAVEGSGAPRGLGLVSMVVREYDEAIAFFGMLGFSVFEDSFVPEQNKRWVVLDPPGRGCRLLLGRASNPEQERHIGNQTGGRVSFFLYTDDFPRDYEAFRAKGVEFARPPMQAPYGTVAVFKDLYGNLWDLVQVKAGR